MTIDIRGNTLFSVLIEWDGKQAPKKWYRRIGKLGLTVGRGRSKDEGPFERRASENGVAAQEGALLVASYSLARTLAHLAYREGAVNVLLGQVEIHEKLVKTRQDEQILNRIERVYGKRGRQPDPEKWTVTCLECLKAHEVEAVSPVNCPNCGGLRIHSRRGPAVVYKNDDRPVVAAWLASRFSGSHFEPAAIADDGLPMVPDMPGFTDDVLNRGTDEAEAVAEILSGANFGDLQELLQDMDRENALLFLDAILVNVAYNDAEYRLDMRLKAITQYLKMGGSPDEITIAELDGPDLFTAAGPLDAQFVAAVILAQERN